MFAIIDIILRSNVDYMNYIRRKTGFLLSPHNPALIQWLWQHLIKDENFQEIPQKFDDDERDAFFELIENFGYLPQHHCHEALWQLEKKYIWLFKHPLGGVFIPLEFFKILMPKSDFFQKSYLFSLIYRMREKEQKNYISLLGDHAREQLSYMSEHSLSDSSLLLYIWMANFHKQNKTKTIQIPKKAQIVKFPRSGNEESLQAEGDKMIRASALSEIFSPQPKPLWQHLSLNFSTLQKEIDVWRFMMTNGKKSFYRALNLVNSEKFGPLLFMFRYGYFVPIFPNRFFQNGQIDEIKVVTPVEVMRLIEANH